MEKQPTIKLVLPIKAPLLNLNQQRRAHWTELSQAKKDTEILVKYAIRKAKLKPIPTPVSVRLLWYPEDVRTRDVDGMAPMLKACLDALVKNGILPDDSYQYVYEAHLGPIIVSSDNPRMELHIRTLDGGGDLQGGGPGHLVPGEGAAGGLGERQENLPEVPGPE